MSPELEVLDQLLGGDLPLAVVHGLFASGERFARSVAAMLHAGEVRLYVEGVEVPRWRWGGVLATAREQTGLASARLAITEAGARKIK
jgi:hypothetical protein